jgi:fatty-acyl-CoA synthase
LYHAPKFGVITIRADAATPERAMSKAPSTVRSDVSYWRQDPGPMPTVQMRFDGLLQLAVDAVPEREALVFIAIDDRPPLRWSYRELSLLVEQAARSLLKSNIRRGDAIAVYAANRPEFVMLQFACSQIGATAVPINPLYSADELAYVLDRAAIRICFAADRHRDQPLWATLTSVAARLDSLELCVALGPSDADAPDWQQWLASGADVAGETLASARRAALPGDTCQIEFTSGTTGRPKAVALSGAALANGGRCTAYRAELEDGCRYLHAMPFFHVGGSVTAMAATVACRGTQIVLPSFSPGALCAALESEHATAVLAVPTMLISTADRAAATQCRFERLRTVLTGGALVPEAVASRWIDRYGVGISNTYGMTETAGPAIQTAPSDPLDRALSTVGRPLPGVEIDIVAAGTDERVPIGTEGEIRLRGWGTMKGYVGDQAGTAAVLDGDGWMRSGDLGVLGDDGFVSVTGRTKDMIIRGGENIAPAVIEDAIREHVEEVVDVSVVGVPDDYYGEAIAAYITLRAGQSLSLEMLTLKLSGHLPRYRIPAHLRSLEMLPTTPSGKVQKYRLVEMFTPDGA